MQNKTERDYFQSRFHAENAHKIRFRFFEHYRKRLLVAIRQMLFQREEATKSTSVLSGGEAARLLFCKLMLQKPNVLVLDEPTNHLDLEAINALNISLQRYQGTVLLVTHDHDLIDEVATRIWHFESNHKITDFKGTYEEYQAAVAV